jgi:hypothetical protein
MNEPKQISYLTDDPGKAYNAGLDAAGSLAELVEFLEGWPTLAGDALAVARGLSPEDWTAWRLGLSLERRRKFAGEDWAKQFGAIVMPERMLKASMVADQFLVPWGLAWKRLVEIEP